MKILIVEDNAIQAISVEMMIKKLGFSSVRKALNVQAAFNQFEEFKPDLMLVDINLDSKLTGVDFVKKVQEKNDVIVIYLTGNSDQRYKKLAAETDYFEYLIKPVNLNILKNVLANADTFER